MEYNLDCLKKGMEEFSVTLTEEQCSQFIQYYEMIVEKNKVMNLTAITEFDEVIEKHFIDSISLAKEYNLTKKSKILDMGTGAGFPGIPLKIAFPELDITLADSLNKRIIFLQDVIDALQLKNIRAIHSRAEELAADKNHREYYDLCVSRAVANLSTLSEYCIPFVKVGGQFISYKSGECDEEVSSAKHAIAVLGGRLSGVKKFSIGESGRAFVLIDKVKTTPKQYPRKAGTPSKKPL